MRPYLLVPIGVTLLTLYFISWLLSASGMADKNLHRKIWNWGLLLAFLTTIILGILMAVQVNLKLEIPKTEEILRWHVNAGIALSVIGFFHLWWHLPYYLKKRKDQDLSKAAGEPQQPGRPPRLPLFAGVIGFISIIAQTLLIREFLTLFYGNEFNIAIILFLWMMLTGLGAFAGLRMKGEKNISPWKLLHLLVYLPVLIILLPGILSHLFIPAGVEAGPWTMVIVLSLTLLPFCLLNGFAFTYASRIYGLRGRSSHKVYGWESGGGLLGGVLVTLLILSGFSNLLLYLVCLVPVLLLVLVAGLRSGMRPLRAISPVAGILLLPLSILVPIEDSIKALHYPNQELVSETFGWTGHSVITRSGEQINLYQNGVLLESQGDVFRNEEFVHFSLLQRKEVGNILVIGGTFSNLVHEILKHEPTMVDLLEPDPRVSALASKIGMLPEENRIRVLNHSPNQWIRMHDVQYRFVLVNLPGPHTLNLNRYYTDAFLKQISGMLEPDAVVVWALPPVANYLSPSGALTVATVFSTGALFFDHRIMLPGEHTYLLMSQSPLSEDIEHLLSKKDLDNLYVNPWYFDPFTFESRIRNIKETIPFTRAVNTLEKPEAFRHYINWWLDRFNFGSFAWILLVILMAGGLLLTSTRPGFSGMYIMGVAGSGMELTCLLALQIFTGFLYQLTGLMIALFMAGLAAGSLMVAPSGYVSARKSHLMHLLLISLLAFITGWIIHVAGSASSSPLIFPWILFVINFAAAFLVGSYFRAQALSLPSTGDPGGKLYGVDLLGAAMGSLLIPLVLIPAAGLVSTMIILACLGLISLVTETFHLSRIPAAT